MIIFDRLKLVANPIKLCANYLSYNYARSFKERPMYPRIMCMYVTYRCNARCAICGIWKKNDKKELDLPQMDNILSDNLFRKLEMININGGEPSLRGDLPEITGLLIKKFPLLKSITMNTNGFMNEKLTNDVESILRKCSERDIRFSVSVSLHAIDSTLDVIMGIKDAYKKILSTIGQLQRLKKNKWFFISVNCVINNKNAVSLNEIEEWGKKRDIYVNYTLGEVRDRFNNSGSGDYLSIEEAKKMLIVAFLKRLSKKRTLFNHHAYRYNDLANMLENGRERRLSCFYAMGGVILGSDGSLYYCKDSDSIGNCLNESAESIYYRRDNLIYRRKDLIERKCAHCPPNTFNKMEFAKDLAGYIKYLCRIC